MMQQRVTFFLLAFIVVIIFSFQPAIVHAQADSTKPVVDDEDTVRQSNRNFGGSVLKDVVYASHVNIRNAEEQLTMDIYKPRDTANRKFPLVLLIHGGGFRVGDKKHLAETCEALADNGYVAAAINYRLGWGSGLPKKACNADTLQLKEAIYRAGQDAHAALRYLAQHADEYSIDKNWFFIGGQSAGAITAWMTAYLSQDNAESFFPGIKQKFGALDNADTTNTGYTLRGLLSMWGAFVDPMLITHANALPTIFFQGEKDPAVPFDTGPFARCPGSASIYGTYPLYNRLKELDVTSIAHVDPEGGHGVFSLDFRIANILCFLKNVREGNKKQVYLTGEQSSCDH